MSSSSSRHNGWHICSMHCCHMLLPIFVRLWLYSLEIKLRSLQKYIWAFQFPFELNIRNIFLILMSISSGSENLFVFGWDSFLQIKDHSSVISFRQEKEMQSMVLVLHVIPNIVDFLAIFLMLTPSSLPFFVSVINFLI